MNPSDLIIPLLLAGAAACGTGRRVNVYAALTRGAEDGLTVLLHVIPALVGLLTAVSMFRASGAMDALAQLCAAAGYGADQHQRHGLCRDAQKVQNRGAQLGQRIHGTGGPEHTDGGE